MFLLKDQTANTESAWVSVSRIIDPDKRANVHADGVFDTATITVYTRPSGSARDGQTTDDLTFTAGGITTLDLSPSLEVMAELSSVGASTSVDLWIG